MNITIAIDKDLADRARRVAAARGISLNQLVRDALERLTDEPERERDLKRLMHLLREHPGRSRGKRWNRDELHDRALVR